mmetsp:Transcript_89319/g.252702  ORF Transcript_89319/g.252702 Transcript_89319/m.252702 type:complete len:516 (+) Transcript_89319:297-1844(+)
MRRSGLVPVQALRLRPMERRGHHCRGLPRHHGPVRHAPYALHRPARGGQRAVQVPGRRGRRRRRVCCVAALRDRGGVWQAEPLPAGLAEAGPAGTGVVHRDGPDGVADSPLVLSGLLLLPRQPAGRGGAQGERPQPDPGAAVGRLQEGARRHQRRALRQAAGGHGRRGAWRREPRGAREVRARRRLLRLGPREGGRQVLVPSPAARRPRTRPDGAVVGDGGEVREVVAGAVRPHPCRPRLHGGGAQAQRLDRQEDGDPRAAAGDAGRGGQVPADRGDGGRRRDDGRLPRGGPQVHCAANVPREPLLPQQRGGRCAPVEPVRGRGLVAEGGGGARPALPGRPGRHARARAERPPPEAAGARGGGAHGQPRAAPGLGGTRRARARHHPPAAAHPRGERHGAEGLLQCLEAGLRGGTQVAGHAWAGRLSGVRGRLFPALCRGGATAPLAGICGRAHDPRPRMDRLRVPEGPWIVKDDPCIRRRALLVQRRHRLHRFVRALAAVLPELQRLRKTTGDKF